MNALPCPACGYDCRAALEDDLNKLIRRGRWAFVPVGGLECYSCCLDLRLDHDLSLDGVGTDRLVPVGVGA